MTVFRRDPLGAFANNVRPTACDKCLEPLDDAPLGSVELITVLGVWCSKCERGEAA